MNCIFNIVETSELRIIGANGVHACLGSILTLECVVNGEIGDTTVWEGTAFGADCEIILLHLRFGGPGTFSQCNDGAITGQSMRVESNSIYISQLEVKVTAEIIGKDIICTHDNGTSNTVTIGRYPINIGIC